MLSSYSGVHQSFHHPPLLILLIVFQWNVIYSDSDSVTQNLRLDVPEMEIDKNETLIPSYQRENCSEELVEFSEKIATKVNVTILGLFELTTQTTALRPRPEGPSELEAAKLAIDRINEMMDTMPFKFHLHLLYNDTRMAVVELCAQCDPGVGVDRFFHALYTSKKETIMPFLLGSACSEVTETLAKIVPYWNMVQVSFGSTAPALSDQSEFPLFVRTVAPDSSHNSARIAFIKYFGWDTVTTLTQTGHMHSLAVNDLVTELEQANITCTATITFSENDYKEQLVTLKELDTRIIIASFSAKLAPRLFCQAWKLGMHGGDYAWILPRDTIDLSGMSGNWWYAGEQLDGCSSSQLLQTLDGLIIVQSYGSLSIDETSSSGLTNREFGLELEKKAVTLSQFAAHTYDAVWAMGIVLSTVESRLNERNVSIGDYTHASGHIARELLAELKNLNFLGVSGPVSFDGPDRIGITAFYQMHGHSVRRIAIYTPEDAVLMMECPGCAKVRWPGGHPPVARRVFRIRVVTIEPAAFLAIACLAGVGIALALSFLIFNLHFGRHKSIKLSSPRLNNMAAVGCALVYGAVILLGFDNATLPKNYFPTICTARVYLLSAGFSLAFGSMFTKTYRVHRIFTRSRSGVVKNKLLQDTQLISLIFVLLLIDGLIVTLWVTLDPMERYLRNLTLEINPQDRAVVYQPQVEVCRSQHTNGWLASLYTYKGLLLVVGVYMAWETRHVKIPALNDSQYIGMSVYSVVITSGIVVVLANLMSDRATLAFITITALILASTTATLALLFLPQLTTIRGGERADPVVESLGLKIECNTRRFVQDDRRELQYRVEVQNRVYRREMAQLDLELVRLERQLNTSPEAIDPSHASSSASIPQRNPSVGGGLPLLLLSVLPPVIPRASWPSADSSGIHRGTVAFSSQPDLEPSDGPRKSLVDIYKLQWRRDTEGGNRLGVFQRLFSLFGSSPRSRKTSAASITGVASVLKAHMGYIAGLVPGTKDSSTCQMNIFGQSGGRPPRCGSGPIVSVNSDEERSFCFELKRKESSEPRVNFSLPPALKDLRGVSPENSSCEKIRGSPRFPHRIMMPAKSLATIPHETIQSINYRWHSMDDTTSVKMSANATGLYTLKSDVWSIHQVGIPLSNLTSLHDPQLTTPNASDDELSIACDIWTLFKEVTNSSPSSTEDIKVHSTNSSQDLKFSD